jgi:hypothetical protein
LGSTRSAVRLEVAHYHVLSLTLEAVAFLQHPDGLSDARRKAQQNGKAAALGPPLFFFNATEQLFGGVRWTRHQASSQ